MAAIRGGLNISACGFSVWGADIAGYYGQPEEEVYIRWLQFGVFSPLMRCHGTTPCEPWYYSKRAVHIYKKFAWIKENFLDYVYSTAVEASKNGFPLMRSLALVYPQNEHVQKLDLEYMYGPDLLVAPVVSTKDTLGVVFPEGNWTHLWHGDVINGPGINRVRVSIDEIPVFLREGALIPVHLSGNLVWGESMSRSRVGALIVTPPKKEMYAKRWSNPTSYTEYTSKPTETGFVVWINCQYSEYILIYGMIGEKFQITINCRTIKEFSKERDLALSAGWYEKQPHRIVVRLPHGKEHNMEVVQLLTKGQ